MGAAGDSGFLRALYQSWSDRMAANPGLGLGGLRSLLDEWHLPTMEPEDVSFKPDRLAGIEGLWALPEGADENKVILYTHGGGFIAGSAASHRKLVGHLAKHLGVTAFAIDYRLAPEHPFPAQLQDATAVYKGLLERGIKASGIITGGDSAGGNLAVSTVLKLREEGVPLPGAVIVLSPWLDMELVGETLQSNAAADALISKNGLEFMAAMFLGETGSRTDPLANPLKADYKGFPRLYVSVGDAETLLDNAQDLARIAGAAGVPVTLSVASGMQHVFPVLAGRAAEADEELARIARWYKGV